MRFKGSVVLVSGSSSGLGYATAMRVLEAGGQVGLLDRSVEGIEKLEAEFPDRTVSIQADVTDAEAAAAAVSTVVEEFGAVHICVNCAGVASAQKVVSRGKPGSLDDFTRVILVNLVGTFNIARVAAAAMLLNDPDGNGERGVIVNTSSGAAFDGQVGQAAYSASKAGVAGMTLPMARDLAGKGIRVNSIAPGLFATRMVATMPNAVRERLTETILEPSRMGKPEEFAALVEHIVENQFLNAETIRLDAGQRMQAR